MSLIGKVVLVGGIYAAYRNKNFILATCEETKRRHAERRIQAEATNAANAEFARKIQDGEYDHCYLSDIAKDRLALTQKHLDMIRGAKNSG